MSKKPIGIDRIESLFVWLRDVCPKCGHERRVMGRVEILRKPSKGEWVVSIPKNAKVETIGVDLDRGCGPCLRKADLALRRKKNAKPKLRLVE